MVVVVFAAGTIAALVTRGEASSVHDGGPLAPGQAMAIGAYNAKAEPMLALSVPLGNSGKHALVIDRVHVRGATSGLHHLIGARCGARPDAAGRTRSPNFG